MSQTISQSFVTAWTNEVHQIFQQEKSYLRDAVRIKNENAQTVQFHKLGAGTATDDPARGADVDPMNVDHTLATATLTKCRGAEWLDRLDEFLTNISFRTDYTKSCVAAVSRKMDSRIVTAMDTSSNTFTNATNAGVLDHYALIAAHKALTNNKVPMDKDRFLVTNGAGLAGLLGDANIASNLYLSKEAYSTGFVSGVMGFNIIVLPDTSLLVAPDGTHHYTYAFHKSAVGLAIAEDISAMVERRPDKDMWQIMATMVCGAVAVDTAGIVKMSVAD